MLFLDKLFKKHACKASSPKSASAARQVVMPSEYLALQDLQNQRQLLEVKIQGSERSYQTMIMAIDLERGLLWIDDLFPQQRMLDEGDTLCIRHHRNAEELVFNTPVIALGLSYGTTGIAVLLPDSAYYQPRRRFARYTIGHQSPLSVKIRPIGQEPSFGTLQDISVGGMRVMIAGNLLPHLRHGAMLPLCEVNLTDELQLRCKARICAFRLGRTPYRHTQISIEFIDIEEEKRAALEQFLCKQLFNTSLELQKVQHNQMHRHTNKRAQAA